MTPQLLRMAILLQGTLPVPVRQKVLIFAGREDLSVAFSLEDPFEIILIAFIRQFFVVFDCSPENIERGIEALKNVFQ